MTIHFNEVEFPALLKFTSFFTNENAWAAPLEQAPAEKENRMMFSTFDHLKPKLVEIV